MEYQDLISKVWRRLEPVPPQMIKLTADYTAGSGSMTFDKNAVSFPSIQPGTIICAGLNVLMVYGVPNQSTGVTSVVGGQQGSTDANFSHTTGAFGGMVSVMPRFTFYDIGVAINDELLALSNPNNGLGQVLTIDNVYLPPFQGYDLGPDFDPVRSKVLEVSYQLPEPMRQNPLIRKGRYRVIRQTNESTNVFPNGNGLIIYDVAFPGFPIRTYFLAPFQPLVNLTDDLLTVAGVPVYMQDIVDMGAELRIAPDREIYRNATEFQRDTRKAQEVPATAVLHSGDALLQRYRKRIDDECANLRRAYRNGEGW
jgi:hypothetical protein